jgi:hypothetical protein
MTRKPEVNEPGVMGMSTQKESEQGETKRKESRNKM